MNDCVVARASVRAARGMCLAIAACWVLAGCAHAPGMALDTGSDALRARADLRPLDAQTVQALRDVRQMRAQRTTPLPMAFRTEAERYEYLVAPQDVLRVTVWDHPELTNPSGTTSELSGRVVNSDGRMFFPHVGEFSASGLNVRAIRDLIANGLVKVIKQPQVDVSVLQYRGQRVVVSGEVRNPGTVAITDVPPELTQVIASAGGFTGEADLAAVTVTRGSEQARLDLQSLYYGGDLRGNIRLRHGDVVNVPERRVAKVFVTGEVQRPTAVLMPRGDLTLADALAEAGGIASQSASAGQVFVIRGDAQGRPQVYHLDASAPDALLLADRFVLDPRDVVYVDTAPVVRWARLINNVLPSATVLRETLNDVTRALPR